MSKKYELILNDFIMINGGVKLYRIRTLKSFRDVKKGDLGGYIEKEGNLSQEGDAWVSGNALVTGHARVFVNALVSGGAWVSGKAEGRGRRRRPGPPAPRPVPDGEVAGPARGLRP